MKLVYLPLTLQIKFAKPVVPDTDPLFVFRSMLGKNLHEMSCAAKNTKCPQCIFNQSCIYSLIFETIIPQDNNVLKGADRSLHPFFFSGIIPLSDKPVTSMTFTITLIGKAIEYAEYVVKAFVQAGETGIFKSRTKYVIEKITDNSKSVIWDIDNARQNNTLSTIKDINFPSYEKTWIWNNKVPESIPKQILVELKTPLRFKTNGNYNDDFSATDFFKCIYRRMMTLCSLYGEKEGMADVTKAEQNKTIIIEEKLINWKDSLHYSARQKSSMKMGGFTGTIKLSGDFSQKELNLLDFGCIFNIGKNTNFGLGQIDYWTR